MVVRWLLGDSRCDLTVVACVASHTRLSVMEGNNSNNSWYPLGIGNGGGGSSGGWFYGGRCGSFQTNPNCLVVSRRVTAAAIRSELAVSS